MVSALPQLPALTPGEQRELLTYARLALEHYVQRGELREEPPAETEVSPRLQVPQGAFVSLHRGSRLRGCVGFTEAARPLVSTVMENAVSAAVRDLRFPPVTAGELPELSIEISVMSPLDELAPADVVTGLHGLLIERGGRRGLLLPQVAAEHHWDRETFLRQLCVKAGIAEDSWETPDARLYCFTAQVFSEEAIAGDEPVTS
jgi:AmmeMemoRadiSam system protein A